MDREFLPPFNEGTLTINLRTEPGTAFTGEPSERDVHVVRRATHDPDCELSDAAQTSMAALQVVDRTRDHVADVDGLTRLWIRHQAVVGELVLAIEHGGKALRSSLQLRVRGDVVDALVAEPHLTIAGA